MIRVWLQGGTGNQLFQLDAGLRASSRFEVPLKVSRASFPRDKLRGFSIAPLLERREICSPIAELLLGRPYDRSGRLKETVGPRHLPVVSAFHQLDSASCLLVGFFQDLDELPPENGHAVGRLRAHAVRKLPGILSEVGDRPVIHVRRGDYVTNPSARRRFGFASANYYRNGLEVLGHAFQDCIVFTDDPAAVLGEFPVSPEQVIEPQSLSDLDTIRTMALSSALVIPNSTFSWWAAECAGKDATVVVPETWFLDQDDRASLARDAWVKVRL
jgi:hypothetical protein